MVIWQVSVSAVSVVMLICITRANCVSYLSSESLTFATPNEEEIEHAENPSIEVRHRNRIINDTLTKNGHYGDIDVVVHAFKERFVLNLILNRWLFASTYFEKIIGASETRYNFINHTENNCYYIGHIQNNHESPAAVSTCDGISGHFSSAGLLYHIEPEGIRFNGPHKVHRFGRKSNMTGDNGTESEEFFKRIQFTAERKRRKRSFNWPFDEDGKTKVLELYIANDHSQFLNWSKDASTVFKRAKAIANSASSHYMELDIYFVLVGMEVWKDADMFPILGSDVNTILNSFNTYRQQNINPIHYNDNAALLTSVTFGGTVGIAHYGRICSDDFSGELIVDYSEKAAIVGLCMAHEIGHLFGLKHDDVILMKNESCYCQKGIGMCIMNATASYSEPFAWSECSLRQFNDSFSHGLDVCLYDVPQIVYDPTEAICGNGIIEDYEQCDCGKATQPDCNPSLCNSTTCHLIGSASCASGRCCDTSSGQIRAAGSLCRNSLSDCDLPEHCDGVVSTCPVDTYRPDGTPCIINGDSVYCYGGKCRSHNSQCQLLWGKKTNRSNTICYEIFNTAGADFGNCGYHWRANKTYNACQRKDVMCGKLFCQTTSIQHLVYYYYEDLNEVLSIQRGAFVCTATTFDFGLKVQDPSLVPNGASCGDGKICVNQTCIDVSSLEMPCSENCQGDQVCNNLGLCQSKRNEMQSTTPNQDNAESSSTAESTFTTKMSTETFAAATASPSISPAIPILAVLLGLAVALSIGLGCYICLSSSRAASLQKPNFVSGFPSNGNVIPERFAVLRSYPSNRAVFFN